MKKGRLFVSDGDVLAPSNFLDLMRIGEREGEMKLEGEKKRCRRGHGSWIFPLLSVSEI